MSERTEIYDVLLEARRIAKFISAVPGTALSFPIDVGLQVRPAVRQLVEERQKIKDFSVQIKKVQADNKLVYGTLLRFEKHAIIKFPENLNRCWSRFVTCKEMGHLLMDSAPSHQSTNPEALIQGLIAGGTPTDASDDVWNDLIGIYFALEVLLPWQIRGQLVERKKAGETDLQIAKLTMCPEKYVNVMLSGGYGQTSAYINQRLDNDLRG